MTASPVCVFEDGQWRPGPLAKGPFGGLHGGVVSGLLAAEMEKTARMQSAGDGLQISVSMLRPTPMAPLQISVRALRQGRRSLQLSAELISDGTLCAIASGLFLTELPLDFVTDAPAAPVGVEGAPFNIRHVVDTPWFYDACEMRRAESGRIWMRHVVPLVEDMGPLARAVSLADWSTGFSRPDWVDANRVVFPNPELSLHLHRPLSGEWLGVDADAEWHGSGLGLTAGALHDETGPLGRSAQPVVLAVLD